MTPIASCKKGFSMKWFLVKTMLMAVAAFGLINYAVYFKTGQSLLGQMGVHSPSDAWATVRVMVANHIPSAASLKLPDIQLPTMPSLGGNESRPTAPITVYKWVDKSGVINYSQIKPNNVVVQEMTVYPETNVVQADALVTPAAKPRPVASVPAAQPDELLIPTPQKMQQLMLDAKNVQQQMNAHNQTLEDVINKTKH